MVVKIIEKIFALNRNTDAEYIISKTKNFKTYPLRKVAFSFPLTLGMKKRKQSASLIRTVEKIFLSTAFKISVKKVDKKKNNKAFGIVFFILISGIMKSDFFSINPSTTIHLSYKNYFGTKKNEKIAGS